MDLVVIKGETKITVKLLSITVKWNEVPQSVLLLSAYFSRRNTDISQQQVEFLHLYPHLLARRLINVFSAAR